MLRCVAVSLLMLLATALIISLAPSAELGNPFELSASTLPFAEEVLISIPSQHGRALALYAVSSTEGSVLAELDLGASGSFSPVRQAVSIREIGYPKLALGPNEVLVHERRSADQPQAYSTLSRYGLSAAGWNNLGSFQLLAPPKGAQRELLSGADGVVDFLLKDGSVMVSAYRSNTSEDWAVRFEQVAAIIPMFLAEERTIAVILHDGSVLAFSVESRTFEPQGALPHLSQQTLDLLADRRPLAMARGLLLMRGADEYVVSDGAANHLRLPMDDLATAPLVESSGAVDVSALKAQNAERADSDISFLSSAQPLTADEVVILDAGFQRLLRIRNTSR